MKRYNLELNKVELKVLRNALAFTDYEDATQHFGVTATGKEIRANLCKRDLEPIMDKLLEKMDRLFD